MKYITLFFLALSFLFVVFSCSQTQVAGGSGIVLVGSTPGDEQVKKFLGIAADEQIDSIRWDLTLDRSQDAQGAFTLNLVYGVSKPNTREFITDKKLSLTGKYTVHKKTEGEVKLERYQLDSDAPKTSFSLIKLNDDLFHILTPQGKLMVGNGGWSYTLNRKSPATNASVLPVLKTAVGTTGVSPQTVFIGRTPCSEIAAQFALSVPEGCFKLKWKITLNRDPKTLAPTTYTARRIDHRPTIIEGKWAIEKAGENAATADAVIYRLDPDKPAQSMAFLAVDENILLVLDKNGRPFVGNGEFSYTLDKAQ